MVEISNPKSWARKNKNKFANAMIVQSGARTHASPAAFFMAGLPGAGKTEFTENLIESLGPKVVRIDMDQIASQIDGYHPEQAHAFREAATDIMNAVFDRVKHQKVDFIMDGTFRSDKAIRNVRQVLEKGYTVKVFYLHQEPGKAWEFTRAREKIEKRAIDPDGFMTSYYEIRRNITQLVNLKLSNLTLDVVIKNKSNKVGEWFANVDIDQIDDLIGVSYNKEELKRMISA